MDWKFLLERGFIMSKKTLTPEQVEIKRLKKENSSKNWRSFLAVVLAVVLTLSVFSLGRDAGIEKGEKANECVLDNKNTIVDENTNTPSDNNVDDFSQNEESNSSVQPEENNDKTENKEEIKENREPLSDNPADWSKEQIASFYKQAATKSHDGAESSQTMTMPKLIVNDGDGALNWFIQLLKPVINSVLEKNTTTYGGITGGYKNLVASDINTAKAYKDGEYTIIEMTMVEQTDGIYGDAQGGTVGHAINVLGNVATAAEQFPDFDIKFEEADIKVHYANPTVKVKINKDGIIEKGTWSYTSEVYIRHLQINSIMIEKADAEIDYVIVVGGGF